MVLVVPSLVKHQKVPIADPSNATASGYASYGSTYDDFSKAVNNSVGVGSSAGQGEKISGDSASTGPSVGAAESADLGPNVYGKTNSQLDKDKCEIKFYPPFALHITLTNRSFIPPESAEPIQLLR